MRAKPFLLLGILLLGCSLGLISCAPQGGSDFDAAAARSAFDAQNAIWAEGMKSGDAEKIMSVYHDDATQMGPNQPILRGKQAIRDRTAAEIQTGFRVVDVKLATTSVEGWGDTAYETGTYTMSFRLPEAADAQSDSGKYLTVWKKGADNTWKYYVEIWNSNLSSLTSGAPATEAAGAQPRKRQGT